MKISVVTPSLNQGEFIEDTVKSVLNQQFDGLQYLVIDGGSEDHTLSVLEPYRERIDVLLSEPDGGHPQALQKGFRMADGEILAFLNSDDVFLPRVLDDVWDFFRANPDIDLIYSDRVFIDARNRVTGAWVLPRHTNYFMTRWPYVPQETAFWRRRAYDVVNGIDSRFFFAFDWDFFIRLMLNGRTRKINRINAGFRLHAGSKTMRLYDSIGRDDIERVRESNGIQITSLDRLIGKQIQRYIKLRSFAFSRPRTLERFSRALATLDVLPK